MTKQAIYRIKIILITVAIIVVGYPFAIAVLRLASWPLYYYRLKDLTRLNPETIISFKVEYKERYFIIPPQRYNEFLNFLAGAKKAKNIGWRGEPSADYGCVKIKTPNREYYMEIWSRQSLQWKPLFSLQHTVEHGKYDYSTDYFGDYEADKFLKKLEREMRPE